MTTFTKPSVSALAMARPSADERELADLDVAPALLGLVGGDAGRRDLRIGEDDRGDAAHVDLRLVPGDHLGDDLGLARGLVRQHRLAGDVADGVDAGDVGAQPAVDGDEAALDLHAHLLQAEALAVRAPADGDQHLVGVERRASLPPTSRRDRPPRARPSRLHDLALAPVITSTPQLLQLARHHLHDLGIVAGQDRGQRLDDRDLRAELRVERADLEADVAAADDQKALRHRAKRQRAGRVDDAVAVELEAGDLDRPRAGGDDDVVGLDASSLAVRLGRARRCCATTSRATPVR